MSFENERFVICFRDFYNAGVSDDCIIGAPAEDCYGDMDIGKDNVFDADISAKLPDITGPGVCYVTLTVEDDVSVAHRRASIYTQSSTLILLLLSKLLFISSGHRSLTDFITLEHKQFCSSLAPLMTPVVPR